MCRLPTYECKAMKSSVMDCVFIRRLRFYFYFSKYQFPKKICLSLILVFLFDFSMILVFLSLKVAGIGTFHRLDAVSDTQPMTNDQSS